MTTSWIALVASAAVGALAGPAAAQSPGAATTTERSAAAWIDRANEALLPGDTMVARVRIVTHDGFGGESADVLDMVRTSEGGATRTLVEVESPEAHAGTAYEIVAEPGEPIDRWAWLADLERMRRIGGVQRTDAFLGTEFTYEDLGLAMPVERREGEARWVGEPPGRVIEIVSPAYHYYSRVVTRIDSETSLPMRVLFYDRAGQLFREQRFEAVEVVDDHPFPHRITIEDRITGARSVMTFSSLAFDAEIRVDRFATSEVRQRLAAKAGEVIPDPPTEEVGAAGSE